MMARLRQYLSFAALTVVLAFWVLVLRPASLGGPASYIIIRGTSMLPTYGSGDLVIVRTAADYRVGDVVAYRVPDGDIGSGLIVIHRIAALDRDGLALRGDNNAAPDPWNPRKADVIGKAWMVVPGFGRVLAAIHQPIVLAALAASVVVAFILAWRPRPRPDGRPLPRERLQDVAEVPRVLHDA
jgi:signal peptidase I